MINLSVAIAAFAICVLALIARVRFRPQHFDSVQQTSGLKPDWILVAFPTALVIQLFSSKAAVFVIGFLVVAAYIRKPVDRFRIQAGPFVLLLASCAIVYSRPEQISTILTLLFASVLVLRLVATVDARRIIASLIDGCGLYLLINVLFYAAGVQSPTSTNRIGHLVESTGFVRIIFPLTTSINSASIVAAVYVASSVFVLLESGWLRRSVRLACLVAAIFVLFGTGSRSALSVSAVLSIAVICFPFVTRWIAQAATLLSAVSAYVLPSVISSFQFAIQPLTSFLAPGRVTNTASVMSLESREYLWTLAINYWNHSINDVPHLLFGYGVLGQYRSGASLTYSSLLASIARHPELALVHNSFLQQLFDGGLLGWLLLVFAAFWTSVRFSNRRREWGNWGLSAIVAMTVLLVSAMTEATMAPGVAEASFWLLLVLAGVACQASGNQTDDSNLAYRARAATATVLHNANNIAVMESAHRKRRAEQS